MKEIILASKSPRRKRLLSTILGTNFKVHVSKYVEDNGLDLSPEEIAKKHSIGKAKDVAKHYNSGVIIAGDAFVVLNNEVLGKPKDEKDAFLMLKKQSGKWISVIGGLCVLDLNENKEYFELVTTNVKIAILTDDEILSYIKTKDPMDKAGSFGMMDLGTVIVEEVQGCFSNVVGLPLPALHKIFREIGIKIFDY